jgi:hypothetical protein
MKKFLSSLVALSAMAFMLSSCCCDRQESCDPCPRPCPRPCAPKPCVTQPYCPKPCPAPCAPQCAPACDNGWGH